MASLTNFISFVKKLDLRISAIRDLGDDLIKEAITEALEEYDDYAPRGFRTATITINIGDTEILLPSDAKSIDEKTLYLIAYNSTQPKYKVPGSYPLRNNNLLATNNPLGFTTDLPLSTSQVDPLDVPLSTDSNGRLSIVLAEAATEARTHDIRYQAMHQISDSPDVNTVEAGDRSKFRKLVIGCLAEARSRAFALLGKTAESARWDAIATDYREQFYSHFNGGFGAIG